MARIESFATRNYVALDVLLLDPEAGAGPDDGKYVR